MVTTDFSTWQPANINKLVRELLEENKRLKEERDLALDAYRKEVAAKDPK